LKAFRIIHPGIHTTVQDLGRSGLMKYGIPPSGAMDQYSYRVGNLLLGNPENSASLEITLHGLKIEALIPVTISITGADLGPYLNGDPAPQWTPLIMKKGEIIHFKQRKKGLRAYLAVKGGFDVPEVLGSRSTFIRGKIGNPISEGEIISIGDFGAIKSIKSLALPKLYIPDLNLHDPIQVIMGPQNEYYTLQGIDTFLNASYKVTSQSDRMAYRTEGPPIEIAKDPGIITEPIPRGAIQVPGDGKPIILLWDAQVTGGYAKIATVISADMDRLGQKMPGDTIHFQQVNRDMAIELLFEKKRKIDTIKKLLNYQD